MAGNTTAIDEVVLPEAVEQFNTLKTAGKELRTELVQLLEVAVKLNATLGGSTPANFAKNLQASTDATNKIIANNNKQIDNEQKKAAKQEEILNKYLVLLSKQEAARQQAEIKQQQRDAKEIAAAEAKAVKLQAIADKQNAEIARKAAVQFPSGPSDGYNPVTSEPDQAATRYEPIITGQENMAISANKSAEAIAVENAALIEQREVLAGLSVEYRANLELLLALQAERAENVTELKALSVEDAASGERAIFLTQRQIELGIAIRQTNLALSQQTKQMLAEDTSGARMQARLDELRVAIGNLSAAELENAEVGGIWLAEAERLDLAIKTLRGSTGDATKNVGAYTTATAIADKVSAQFVRQLVRMAAQFLLITVIFGAITWLYDWIKGLDYFTGRLDQATQNLKSFNEVQKNAASSAGEIVGKYRILSDTIKDLSISYEDRLKAATELKKLFPEELEHSTAQAIANGTEAKSLDKLTDSVVKLAKAKAAATEIEKTEGEIIALQIQRDKVNAAKSSQMDATNKGNGYDKLSFFDQLAVSQSGKPSKDDLKKIFKQQADDANKDIEAQIKLKEGTIKLLEQYGGLQKESEAIESKSTLNPKVKKPKDTANKDLLESQRIDIEIAKNKNKQILDDDNYSYDARLVALNQYIKKSKELLEKEAEILNADNNLRPQQRLNDLKKLKNQELEIDIERLKELDKLNKEEIEKHKKLLQDILTADKEHEQEQLEDLNQGAIVAAQKLNDNKENLINTKTLEFSEGKISEKQFNRDLLAINDEYNVQRIAQEITLQNTILALKEGSRDVALLQAKQNGATPAEIAKITSEANKGIDPTKNRIAELTTQYKSAVTKKKVDSAKGDDASDNEKKKALQESLGDAKDIVGDINDLVDKGYENQISKLDKVGQKIQENADIEKAAIENSLDTQANKARRQLVLDAQTASQQKAIQAEIAREKTKQARADKVAAIAEIILNTAIAASKVVAQTGLLGLLTGVPAVIALGAIQLAKVAATPIPQFYKGTPLGGHRGGLAWYGEKGRELVEEPGKPAYYSPGVATLVNLPKGTKITPNHMLPKTPEWVSSTTDNRGVIDAIDRLASKEQPRQRTPRLAGWVEAQRQADAWNNTVRNHFR
jgi:hypothetical protein